MRVALLFDGPNFYRTMEAARPGLEIDYDQLATWLVERVGGPGCQLVGAWYHTGLNDQPALDRFLRGLEQRTGYFVRRHRVVERESACSHCGHVQATRVEKGVDTAVAVEMVRLAARGGADRIVLLSGDEDLLPGVAATQDLGVNVWLATWGGLGVSAPLRATVYGHVDLIEGVGAFSTGRSRAAGEDEALPSRVLSGEAVPPEEEERVLEQVRVAAAYFEERGGHLSRWYFENRWDAVDHSLPLGSSRRQAVDALVARGDLVLYEASVNGRSLVALKPSDR